MAIRATKKPADKYWDGQPVTYSLPAVLSLTCLRSANGSKLLAESMVHYHMYYESQKNSKSGRFIMRYFVGSISQCAVWDNGTLLMLM